MKLPGLTRAFVACLLLVAEMTAGADDIGTTIALPPGVQIPDAAQPGPQFDVDRATRAYFEGG